MKTPKGFFTYFHHAEVLDALTDEQAGRLYKALLRYGHTGEVADFSGDAAAEIAYILFKSEIDFNFERYAETCEMRSEAGRKSGESRRKKSAAGNNKPTTEQNEHLFNSELSKDKE
jgi:hypothetical protein